MDIKRIRELFSLPIFLIGAAVSVLLALLLKSPWLLLCLLAAAAIAIAIPYFQERKVKENYVQVLEKRASENFEVILENIRKMLVAPDEVESVHQLRVSIRRFRSIISLAKPQMPLKRYIKIQDFFRQRGQELAALREMDVLIKAIESCEGLEGSQMSKRLQEMRVIEQENVVRLLDDKYVEKMTKKYNEFLDIVRSREQDRFTTDFDDRIEGWDQYIINRMPKVNDLPWDKVHRVRIKSKKARYISEMFDGDIDENYSNRRKEYKKIQSDLGERCDQLRNVEAIDEWIKDDNPIITKEKEIFKAYTMNEEVQGLDELQALREQEMAEADECRQEQEELAEESAVAENTAKVESEQSADTEQTAEQRDDSQQADEEQA